MRRSLLDIKTTPDRCTPQPATVVRMDIQPGNRLSRRQHDGQQQLCVPLVMAKGDSHRLAEALAGKGVIPLAT